MESRLKQEISANAAGWNEQASIYETTSAPTVRQRKAKYACRDTHNSINWLRLYAQWPRSLSKGEAAKPGQLHRLPLGK